MLVLIVKKKYGSFQLNGNDFEGAKNANKCLPYDFVIPTSTGCSLSRRNEHPRLVGILQTTGAKYGFTSHGNPIYLCKPLDERYPPFYIGSKIKDILSNKLITFKFDSWPENSEFPKGTFMDLVGDCGDCEAEKKASFLKANGYKWNKVLPAIIEPSKENCLYLNGFTFNIDPEGCKDIDDCFTLLENGFAISIANVAKWVEVNPWMKYAEYMGTSLYENGVCVKPMFPPVLSENLMSLVKDKERHALSLIIQFDEKNEFTCEFKETLVKVDESYTYDNFPNNDILNNYVYKLTGLRTTDNHKIVELLMLFYNTIAGKTLKEKNMGLLRKQKGVNLHRASLFERFSDTYMYLCYESASYCLPNEDTTHTMLNIKSYAHASSPIRRYVDIINQMALKGKILEYSSIERFNNQQKAAKKYEQELLFIDLYYNKKAFLDGIILNEEKIFIPVLKKIIQCENILEPKSNVKLLYYTDKQKVGWKDKIIFQIKYASTNSLV
uniref:RNB domain-containing protein n=1 Tax=viral metagenome TaxID=1070528 RepID=A0A6C0D7G7_9ZZZZ